MRAYVADPILKTVTEIDYDGTGEMLCELLGQPAENIDSFRMNDIDDDDDGEFHCLYFKKAGTDLGAVWSFGKFDGRHCWDVGIVGRLVLCGSKGIAAGAKPHSSALNLDQAKQYVEFMRDDLVTVPMDDAVMMAGKNASDEVRAMAREHNASRKEENWFEILEEAGLGAFLPKRH